MTERLSTLLREEAQALDIPVPPAASVLATGRSQRRRQRLGTGAALTAIIAVAAAGAVVATDGLGSGDDPVPATSVSGDLAFAVGRDVHLGGPDDPVITLDEDVHSLHYTSAGVVVRTNLNGGVSDGSGPEHFTLIRPDGTTKTLDLTTEDIVVSTDADQPLLAYSTISDGTAQVVIRDVTSDKVVARVDLPDNYKSAGWPSPPVWLDGDTAYVGYDDLTLAVDWATGEIEPAEHLDGGMPVVYDGRTTRFEATGEPDFTREEERTTTGKVRVSGVEVGSVSQLGLAQVIDVATGEVLLSVEVEGYGSFELSPEGRYAILQLDAMEGQDTFDVYDVDTGAKVTVNRSHYGFGWTTEGGLFRLEENTLVTCDPATGQCATEPSGVDADDVLGPDEPMPGDLTRCDQHGECVEVEPKGEQPLPVKIGGRIYES